MTEAEAEEAIKQFWESEWETLHSADPTDPDHVPFCLDDEAYEPVTASWVRFTLNPSTRDQVTMGDNPMYFSGGTIMVQVFGPPDAGGAAVVSLCDDVRTVLETKRIEDIIIRAGASRKADSGDPRWAMRVVTFRCEVEEQT